MGILLDIIFTDLLSFYVNIRKIFYKLYIYTKLTIKKQEIRKQILLSFTDTKSQMSYIPTALKT